MQAGVLKHHDDPPPSALAHGATKPSDIERVRDDVGQAEQRVARWFQAAIAHYGQRTSGRAVPGHGRLAATTGPCRRATSATGPPPSQPSSPAGDDPRG